MDMTGFDELADLALRKSGQAVHRRQAYLIEARLSDILRRESFSTLTELSDCLKARPNPAFEDEVVTAMASKETQFFQDREALVYIVDKLLPDFAAKQDTNGEERPIRILCAGGCTGQEPYSLAILVDEAGEEKRLGRKVELISVDMCKASTQRAKDGIFNHFEIQMWQ
jgi:chemotaxis protein methyltransferase CheR